MRAEGCEDLIVMYVVLCVYEYVCNACMYVMMLLLSQALVAVAINNKLNTKPTPRSLKPIQFQTQSHPKSCTLIIAVKFKSTVER